MYTQRDSSVTMFGAAVLLAVLFASGYAMSTEFVVVGVLGGLITGGLILYIIYDLFDIMALTEESAELFREELIAVLADEHARIDEYRAAVAEKEKNLE